MKRFLALAAISLTLCPPVNLAEGFKVDMSTMEAIEHLEVLNIGSLAVGETGLVSIYRLRTCTEKGELRILSTTELDTEPSEYSYDYEVTRHPNEELSVVLSKKGKKPDVEAVKRAALSIISSSDCRKIKEKGIPLLKVKSFLGSDSLSELLASIDKFAEQAVSETPAIPHSSKMSETVSDWIVIASKSPIDDSPSVMISRSAEIGEQTLVIRCAENKTDAYIITNDFLGDESKSVIVTYDGEKARKQQFLLSTNKRALFFSPAISDIKTMMKSKKVVIRYDTYNGMAKTVTFKLDGLSEKVASLRKACNW
jgi:type VI secretion system VasI family protein